MSRQNWTGVEPGPAGRRNSRAAHHGQAGFTLIEILVVVAIIAILAGIVAVNVLHKPGEARVAAASIQIKQLATALRLYRTEQGVFPTQAQGLEALVVASTSEPRPRVFPPEGYLEGRSVPADPWGEPYIYLIPGRNGEPFEVISYGSDREPGGEGNATDLSSATL